MTRFRHLHLLYHTVRYLRPEQILWRMLLRSRAVLDRTQGQRVESKLRHSADQCIQRVHPERFLPGLSLLTSLNKRQQRSVVDEADRVMSGQFTFQNQSKLFKRDIDWAPPDVTLLWQYHLHYFEYLFIMGMASYIDPKRRASHARRARQLIESWWISNPLGRGVGWRPYPLALRIVSWIYAACCFHSEWEPGTDFRKMLDRSIMLQALYLRRRMERDVGGNHLLKNAKALFLAGLYGHGAIADAMAAEGERILLGELSKQVLDDGGHYERSAHYHRIVLVDWIESLAVSRAAGRSWPKQSQDRIQKALNYLECVLHPDDGVPLFGDAGTGEWPAAVDVIVGARYCIDGRLNQRLPGPWAVCWGAPPTQPSESPTVLEKPPTAPEVRPFPDTGYYVAKYGHVHAMIDCGPPCPPDLPAHAHSDALSIELSWGRHRLVVDPGTYLYQAPEWRSYLRSTEAHNTVHVPGEEQTETWGHFRAARRGIPVGARYEVSDSAIWVAGGVRFGTKRTLTHRRWLLVWSNGLLIVDHLSQVHPLARARMLIAPDHKVSESEDGCVISGPAGEFTVAAAGATLDILPPNQGPGPGWYSPQFGVLIPGKSLEWAPSNAGWFALALIRETRRIKVRQTSKGTTTILWPDGRIECQCSPKDLSLNAEVKT